ncbi:hypothetical protein [Taibaiella chishuiensis]|uniref:Uncharacterized protein n=1 Tax=Taibaiella chishuiensis TaxID=1434707 RepID=A0A2P8CXV5_9BACT|nr:hypothetical protein [Taibaiella chishuiensis]PSK89798.1 hypothetical protein B0I18_11099 [Taibaiella chishuiensis]
MPPVPVLVIIAVLFGGSFVYIYFMNRKRKESMGKYNDPHIYNQAPQFMTELLSGRFAAIDKQMQGAPVHAITQCAYITSLSDKAKAAAGTAVKTLAWAAVGVKARYSEADHAAYLVLSGEDLHYIFFEEGQVKEHLVFDRGRLMTAAVGSLSHTEKVARMGSVAGRNTHKLNLDIEGKKVDLIYFDTLERYPDSVLAYEKNAMDTMGKFKLMGSYFKDKLYAAYPHLSN